MDDSARRLQYVLAGQTFPAGRWELITTAEAYGADNRSLAELRRIPATRYRSLRHVVVAIHEAAQRDLLTRFDPAS